MVVGGAGCGKDNASGEKVQATKSAQAKPDRRTAAAGSPDRHNVVGLDCKKAFDTSQRCTKASGQNAAAFKDFERGCEFIKQRYDPAKVTPAAAQMVTWASGKCD